jgi:hypothetical protein
MTTQLTRSGRRKDGSLGITDKEWEADRTGVLERLRAEGDLDFGPAVLDPEHLGDIKGSLGTVSVRPRAAAHIVGAPAHVCRHHGPRHHRDDR